jgi:hypothetical protein
MENLIKLIGEQLTPDVVRSLGNLSGTTPAQTKSAIGAIVPSLVGALAKQGATPAGAQQVLDLVGKQTDGANILGNLTGLLGNATQGQGLLSSGAGIVSSLMGSGAGNVLNTIASTAGISGSGATSLLQRIAPVALAVVGKLIGGGKLNAGSLSSLLGGQTDFVKAAAPRGVLDALGIRAPTVERYTQPEQSSKWFWWLIGIAAAVVIVLVLLGAFVWS